MFKKTLKNASKRQKAVPAKKDIGVWCSQLQKVSETWGWITVVGWKTTAYDEYKKQIVVLEN